MQRWLLVGLWLVAGAQQALAADDAGKEQQETRLWEAFQAHPQFRQGSWYAFYRQRGFEAYWVDPKGGWFGGARLSKHGKSLLQSIRQAHTHGLNPRDYSAPALEELSRGLSDDTPAMAKAERLLMNSYLALYRHLAEGRYPALAADTRWHISQDDYSEEEALKRLGLLGPEDALNSVLPALADYKLLRQARQRMQIIVQDGGWPKYQGDGLLRPGMRSDQVPALRERLAIAGDLSREDRQSEAEYDPELFDGATVTAFRAFQRRHGIEEDGIVGPNARAMLNYTAEQRLAQIDANLERLRWMPIHLADDRIMVNIAAYDFRGFRGDQELLDMRVVVGNEQTQTPAFADVLEYIEINPYWSIPNSIVVNELAPQLVKNIHYLESRHMQIYEDWDSDADTMDADDIDWEDYADPQAKFPYVIRQDPGPWNALGRIKFMFPNEYAIYLHDTPETELFSRAQRSFSHGCIRLQKPMAVAEFVLRHTTDWDMARLEEELATNENQRIELDRRDRLRVYIVYFTAWADPQGTLYFRPDLYQRDALLVKKFLGTNTSMISSR